MVTPLQPILTQSVIGSAPMGIEIEFLQVGAGSGDAICVRYGSALSGYTIHLIDGGHTSTSDTIISHIRDYYGTKAVIDHIVLSHADNDHARGLIKIVREMDVRNIWMNRPWLYSAEVIHLFHGNYTIEGLSQRMKDLHPYLIEIEEAASKKSRPPVIREAFQGATIGEFIVLAPSRARYIELIPQLDKTPTAYRDSADGALARAFNETAQRVAGYIDEWWNLETLSSSPNPPTSASNETCIVQMGIHNNYPVLLTADVGPVGLREAYDFAVALGLPTTLKFIQVPHHGSRKNVTPDVLDLWLGSRGPSLEQTAQRGTAYCSVGSNKLDTYPRKSVSNAFRRRGYHVYRVESGFIRHAQDIHREGLSSIEPIPFYYEVEE